MALSFVFFQKGESLTFDEATRYNSQILLCETKQVNHWKLIVIDGEVKEMYEYRIMDVLTKKLYKLEACSLYKCSPRPDRMKGCIMKGYETNEPK